LRFYKRFNIAGTTHSKSAIEHVDKLIEIEEQKQ
jgi:hypothetical protein